MTQGKIMNTYRLSLIRRKWWLNINHLTALRNLVLAVSNLTLATQGEWHTYYIEGQKTSSCPVVKLFLCPSKYIGYPSCTTQVTAYQDILLQRIFCPLHLWAHDDIMEWNQHTVLSTSPAFSEDSEKIFSNKSYMTKLQYLTNRPLSPSVANGSNPVLSPIQQTLHTHTMTHTIAYTHCKHRAWTSIKVPLKFGLKEEWTIGGREGHLLMAPSHLVPALSWF